VNEQKNTFDSLSKFFKKAEEGKVNLDFCGQGKKG